ADLHHRFPATPTAMPHIPRSGLPRPSAAAIAAADPGNPLPRFAGTPVELDVRDELRAGREPFSLIMAAVDGLAPDEVLHLRATFEPVPLFHVLGRRGYEHHSVAHAPDDWSIWFYQPTDPVPGPSPLRPDPVPTPAPAAGSEIILDVRGLEPP